MALALAFSYTRAKVSDINAMYRFRQTTADIARYVPTRNFMDKENVSLASYQGCKKVH